MSYKKTLEYIEALVSLYHTDPEEWAKYEKDCKEFPELKGWLHKPPPKESRDEVRKRIMKARGVRMPTQGDHDGGG